LGFAVHRPAHRSASPRSHGMPCRDVLGRVHIRMIEMFADATAKNRLALTILRIAMPTSIAGLGCVGGLDLFYAARILLLQPGNQSAPSGRMDGSVESGLGPDVRPRKLHSAASRTNQIPDLQVLDADDLESADQMCGSGLDPILTPVDLPSLQLGDRGLDALPSNRPPLGPSQLSLQPQQTFFFGPSEARHPQKITSRQGGRHGDTSIDADDLTVTWSGERLRDSGEGDVPAIRRVPGDAVGPHVAGDGAGPSEPHPADLRDPYEIPDKSGVCVVLRQRLFLDSRRLKAKPHVSTLSTVTDKRRRERRLPPTTEVGVFTPRIP
jgi:hypothetical protein